MKHSTQTIIAALFFIFGVVNASNAEYLDSTVVKSNDGGNQVKYVFTYDEFGKKVKELTCFWNNDRNAWMASTNLERKFDIKGNLIEEVNYAWNSQSKQWVSTYLTVFSYDFNGNKLLELQYVWDETVNVWIENYKYEIAYDGSNNQISMKHFKWDANAEWVASLNSANNSEATGNYGFTVLAKTACLCE